MKILLVDDDEITRHMLMMLIRTISSTRYLIREASDGVQGYKLFLHWKPDLIITDYSMPEMNGEGLAKAIRRRDPSTHIVLYAADTRQTSRPEIFDELFMKGDFLSLRTFIVSIESRCFARQLLP